MLRRLAISVSIAAISLSATFPAFAQTINVKASDGADITATVLAEFDSAWAMTMLPDGRMLVTEKGGTIWLLAKDGEKLGKITGAPDVTARGQGGLGVKSPKCSVMGIMDTAWQSLITGNYLLPRASVKSFHRHRIWRVISVKSCG